MTRAALNLCPSREEVNWLIDGELSAGRELEVRWHIDVCLACARLLGGVEALKRAVGRAYDREVPSPALRRSVLAPVSTAAPRRSKRKRHARAATTAVG